MIQCALDAGAMREQQARYAALAVSAVERDGLSLSASLAGSDPALVAELVAVERECCPFFAIDWDGSRLRFSVAAPEHAAALDAIADLLAR